MKTSVLKDILLKIMTGLLASVLLVAAVSADAAPAARKKSKKSNAQVSLATAPAPAVSATKKKEEKRSWVLAGTLSNTRNLYEREDGKRTNSSYFEGVLILMPTETWKSLLVVGYSRNELNPAEESGWEDTALLFQYSGWTLSSAFSLAPEIVLVAPTSQGSVNGQNLHGVLGGGLKLGVRKDVLPAGMSLSFKVTLNRLWHEYETSSSGSVLSAWSSKQTLSAGYSIGSFSLSTRFVHGNSMTYQDTLKESFEHAQELGYTITDNFSVAVGHTLSGNMLKPNGTDSNFALMNENESKVYGSISASY